MEVDLKKPEIPDNEDLRIAALKEYRILDTVPEQLYNGIVELASQICGTPIALISLIDEKRQWFKAKVGLDVPETSREFSFCGHAIAHDYLFEIPNALADERFADNPLVTGDPRIMFYAGQPLKTPSGARIGTICVIDHTPRELTPQQRKGLETLAVQVVALLEMRSAVERSKKLNAQLAEAKTEADRASIAKSQFLANMSHEIRTPLGAIIGFTELLKDEKMDRFERSSLIDVVNRNAKSLTRVIDDILDLSKVEAGRMSIETSPISLNEILADVESLFIGRASEAGVILSIEIAKGIPDAIQSDAVRLRQILVNIVGNAIKFTEKGSIKINVSAEPVNTDEFAFKILVADTGIGLSPEQCSRLFQPFTQADSRTSREYGGTGLGLVLSQRLAEALGGTVSIEHAELGKGCTFKIVFRAKTVQALRIVKSGVTVNSLRPLDRIKILVIEDSPDNQFLIERVLTLRGAEVEIADNGKIGVEKALATAFDVVLMDIQMPVMDGWQAMQALKEVAFATPVVALSAHAMSEEKEKAERAGFAAYITKPIEVQTMVSTIKSVYSPPAKQSGEQFN